MSSDVTRGAVGTHEPRTSGLRTSGFSNPVVLGVVGFATTRVVTLMWCWLINSPLLSRQLSKGDGDWYLELAQQGYSSSLETGSAEHPTNLAFFPLYPGLIRFFTTLGIEPRLAALAISLLASLVAAWGLVRLGELLYSSRVGVIMAILWGVLPASIALSMVLTEALFVAFAVWVLVLCVQRRLIWASVLTIFAGLARPTAIALVLAVWWAAWVVLRTERAWRAPLVAVLIAPLGWLGFVLWVGNRLDDVKGYWLVQDQAWNAGMDFGASVLSNMSASIFNLTTPPYFVATWLLILFSVLFVLLVRMRARGELIVYSATIMLMCLTYANYFQVRERFLLTAFPLLIPVAHWLSAKSNRLVALVVVALCVSSAYYGSYLLFTWRYSV